MSFVLIVEPEEVNAARIRAIMESLELDFEYRLETSEEAAIMAMEERTPDVFIADMQTPVMSATELFSMVEMMSPTTVRVVMTDGANIEETVAFMNECKTYKIIIKPCRVADDLLVPINAALAFREKKAKVGLEHEKKEKERSVVDEEFLQIDKIWRQQSDEIKRIQHILVDMLSVNVDADKKMEEKVAERIKRWYQFMVEEYVHQVINGSGDYKQIVSSMVNFCHEPKYECSFQMKNMVKETISPQKLNEISYLLRIVVGVCKDMQLSYRIQAVIEKADKVYILRVRYCMNKDEEGVGVMSEYRIKNPQIRDAIIYATKIGVAALGYKSAVLNREQDDILSIALPI